MSSTKQLKQDAAGSAPVQDVHIDAEGGLVRISIPYDPTLIARIKVLTGRRFIRERGEWAVPATPEGLRQVDDLAKDLDGRVRLSDRAARRLERARVPHVRAADGGFELTFPYRPALVERVRALPERRYDPRGRRWTISATRAGALALLELLAEGDFTAGERTRERLARLAAESARGSQEAPASRAPGTARSSPIPHWRHVTRGAVFEGNPQRREWVEGIGWCVRIRVDPAEGNQAARAHGGRRGDRRGAAGPA